MNNSGLRDNYKRGKVGDFLKEHLDKNSDISIVSAYFTIYAYDMLKEKLKDINSLKFLFGEPTFVKSVDPNKVSSREYKIEDDKLTISPTKCLTQKSVAKGCADWIRSDKVQIKSMVKPNFLHGKMYHIKKEGGIERAIVGSSNFTVNGLGLGGSQNIELNLIVDSDRDRDDLKKWFEEIWNEEKDKVEDVKKEVLKYIEQLTDENSPRFIYLKTLYHIFENRHDEQISLESTNLYDSEIWKTLYPFQRDGVKAAINKINKYGGCIIADSVGLGKTYEALAVIKHFESMNAKVLVICPKKLNHNWTLYQDTKNNKFNPLAQDRFRYNVLSHTDLCRTSGTSDTDGIELDDFIWGAYDLIVVDESHNFRGNPTEKDGKMNRAKWLLEKVIKGGYNTKVLLLSATPVNNTLKDLQNQIHLITKGNDNAYEEYGLTSINSILGEAQKNFNLWIEDKIKNDRKKLLEGFDSSFYKLLDTLTIARSRKHIKEYYDLDKTINFPKRQEPTSVYTKIDSKGEFPSYQEINDKIHEYKLSIFTPSKYVKEEYKSMYEGSDKWNFTQEDREYYLIGMMKVNYLKRLESSISSFKYSIERAVNSIIEREEKIKKFLEATNTEQENGSDIVDFDQNDLKNIDDDIQDEELWEIGKKLKYNLEHLNVEDWLIDLENDKKAMQDLLETAKKVEPQHDAKLIRLKELITDKVNKPFNANNKKVLIFTAFVDTAEYIYDNIKDWVNNDLKLHIALVTGSKNQTTFGSNKYNSILTNFSPISKKRADLNIKDTDEIDILIATDCISEGQNLQDCDLVINYEIHWNPVRIIQRFGRIDRLNSKNKEIKMINFWPTVELENYLNLQVRVRARMALADIAATGEENPLEAKLIEEYEKYRDNQIIKLKDEILDLEDLDESISLTDFTFDEFRMDIAPIYVDNYEETDMEKKKRNQQMKKRLENAPLGLYALVPAPGGNHADLIQSRVLSETEKQIVQPGIIFCLRQINVSKENSKINSLTPYYLLYIRNDGTVRYNYTSAKQILRIYKLLCYHKEQAIMELADIFNKETQDGKNVDKESILLKTAIDTIVNTSDEKRQRSLTKSRDAILPIFANQAKEEHDFELITWLIIK